MKRRSRRLGLHLVLMSALASGCPDDTETGGEQAADQASSEPRKALDAERRELADPQRYPLRRGIKIDEEALRQAIFGLRSRHGSQVAIDYAKTIEALPTIDLPAAPGFTEVARFDLPDEPAMRDAEAMNWLFDESIEVTVRRSLFTFLGIAMYEHGGISSSEIGIWLGFLRAAEPRIGRCGAVDVLWVCVDYGADVFVLELRQREPAWFMQRLRWMQAVDEDAWVDGTL